MSGRGEAAPDSQPVGDLDAENNLINVRLTWMTGGQTLLFLAYGALATAKLGPNESFVADDRRAAALYYIPLVGYWASFAILTGVFAAIVAFIMVARRQGKRIGVHPVTTIGGFVPPVALPGIFMAAWRLMAPDALPFDASELDLATTVPLLVFVVFVGMVIHALRTRPEAKRNDAANGAGDGTS